MKLAHKIYLAIGTALVIGSLFFVARGRVVDLLETQARVLHRVAELERLDVELNGEAWRTAFLLYNNYDAINHLLERSSELLGQLQAEPLLKGAHYQEAMRQLRRFEALQKQKQDRLNRFSTLNSLIKNSVTYIPTLNDRYISGFGRGDDAYLLDLSQITSNVFLASNALDPDLLEGMQDNLTRLRARRFDDPQRSEFNRVFLAHADVFLKYLPQYLPAFEAALESGTREVLHQANDAFVVAGGAEAERVSRVALAITAAFILSIAVIVYFLVDVERKHKLMVGLNRELQRTATTDRLTGLGNRYRLDKELEKLADESPALLIVNIDGFKNVNDLFGHASGDMVLASLAEVLVTVMDEAFVQGVYRVGADDFAVLLRQANENELSALAHALITVVQDAEFLVRGHAIPVNISVGGSRQPPLLETADMVLKHTKFGRSQYLEYQPTHNIEARAEQNLAVLKQLRDALQNNAVVPFFMPIMNLRTGQVDHFECLIRVRQSDGGHMHPGQFLEVAKESRMYGDLTRIMIAKSIDRFSNTSYGFSINLSIEDILDDAVTDFLFSLLEVNPGIGPRLTIELLESEEVLNYEAVSAFVQTAHGFGCKIAIDDFGAGYSSLRHLLKLKVDNLKIDASLIKDIHSDANSRATVAAIVQLARDTGIGIVTAEFVHSREVFDVVCQLGVDKAQGYYIGPPMPEILELPGVVNG